MVATAAMTTIAGAELIRLGHAALLQRLGNKLMDRVLSSLQFLLRLNEPLGDWMTHQALALALEGVNLTLLRRCSNLLFMSQIFTFFDDASVERLGFVVGQEFFNMLAQGLVARLVNDRLAKFQGSLDDGGFCGYG